MSERDSFDVRPGCSGRVDVDHFSASRSEHTGDKEAQRVKMRADGLIEDDELRDVRRELARLAAMRFVSLLTDCEQARYEEWCEREIELLARYGMFGSVMAEPSTVSPPATDVDQPV
jgi:hypothetical protein